MERLQKTPTRDVVDEPIQRAPASSSSASADASTSGADGGGAPGAAPAADGSSERAGAWEADANLMDAIGLGGEGDAGGGADAAADGGGASHADAAQDDATASPAGAQDERHQSPEERARRRKLRGGKKAGDKAVQRKETGEVADATEVLSGRDPGAAEAALGDLPTSGGAAVDSGIASNVERATGEPVGDVQVHTGPESARAADAISARAFTTGSDIHLAAGESPADAGLMAHEVAHTIQQTRGAKVEAGVSQPGDALEVEADRVAEAATSGGTAHVSVAAGNAVMRDAVSDVESLLSYGAFDWAITDAEATRALSILSGLSLPALTTAMGRLGQVYKTRLLENLPDSVKQTSGYTKVLVAMGPSAVLPYVRDLLSYGVFDWAVTDQDASEVFRIFRALPAASQATLTTSLGAKFRARLASNLQREATIGPDEQTLLRVLFDNTPEAEIDTLCRWVAIRFNLTVTSSTDDNGTAWDKPGLRRCWDVLMMLPASHVENNADLKSLTRYRAGSIEGWASDEGEAAIGYGDHAIDTDTEVGDYTDVADPLRGKNLFDATVRHEIGHRVDPGVGGSTYCQGDNAGAWQTWDSTDGMAERMVTASAGAISTWAQADQKQAIISCLQGVIEDRAPDEINDRLEALDFCVNHASDPDHATNLTNIKGDNAVRQLRICFSDAGPWQLANGGIALGDGRIYQESYDWPQWVSYKQEARARKMSRYQFRAPGEWFAEVYAAYYQPPGAKGALLVGRDDDAKAWFDSNVDPDGGAGPTAPPGAAPPAGGSPAPAGGAGGAGGAGPAPAAGGGGGAP